MFSNVLRQTRPIWSTPVHRTQWLRISRRGYMWEGEELEWLEKVRKEMVGRRSPTLRSSLSKEQAQQFEEMLESVLPSNKSVSDIETGILPLGHHLAFFNPDFPKEDLLPDGTDTLHSPGGPFTSRLWGGGNIRVDLERYFGEGSAWRLGRDFECEETIKAVRVGATVNEPILSVIVDRRFAWVASADASQADVPAEVDRGASVTGKAARKTIHEWSLKEVRKLVFRRNRGETGASSRLGPPIKPRSEAEFSHSLVPTENLLSEFSRLTLNHHLIHLDREHTRKVEGHPNLLVHGPLTLALMLRLLTNHLHTLPGPPRAVTFFEYRNYRPLYCDEPMRVCGRLAEQLPGGVVSKYDVWIEDPTGGLAVAARVAVETIPGAAGATPSGNTDIEPATNMIFRLGRQREGESRSPAAPPEVDSSRPKARGKAADKSKSKGEKKSKKTPFELHGVRKFLTKGRGETTKAGTSAESPSTFEKKGARTVFSEKRRVVRSVWTGKEQDSEDVNSMKPRGE